MKSRRKEKGFNQIKADEVFKSFSKPSFFSKLSQRFPAKVGGAAISALIVLHFVSQFIFFQNENVQNEITAPRTENEQIIETKTEDYEALKPEAITIPEPPAAAAPPIASPERKAEPLPKAAKKKQFRESKAERLRRAERILTGV